jgi:enoyl-CoA hydratase
MTAPLLRVEREGGVAVVTFDDPERRNAMSQAMGETFAARMAELRDDESLRALVLTGAGGAFSAGGDLSMIGSRAEQGAGGESSAADRIRATMRSFYELFLSVRDLPCPTVAAINGHAIGAGLCVALACDLRIAAEDAKLALNFTRLGLHPGMGATWTLPRIVGPAIAAELLYTGRVFTGAEAARLGVVSRAVPRDQTLAEGLALARAIAAAAPLAVRGVKRSLRVTAGADLPAQLDVEAREQALCFATLDVREGLAAVREKREPRFEGK